MTAKDLTALRRRAIFHVQSIGQAAHDAGIDASAEIEAALTAVDEMDIGEARRILATVQQRLKVAPNE